jgi:hypothetical protein
MPHWRNRLTPGTPVIINDFDCPDGRLIAVITRCDSKNKLFRARYLSEYPSMIYCTSDGGLGFPTPIEDFGVNLEWNDEGKYRAVPNGHPSVALYRDGKPRKWHEPHPKWNTPKKLALQKLDSTYKAAAQNEIKKEIIHETSPY